MEKQSKNKGLWLLCVFTLALAMLPVTGGKAWAEPLTVGEFTYAVIEGSTNNEVSITKYNGSATSLEIDATFVDGDTTYTVTEIGTNAFQRRTSLESLTLPNTVTSIGDKAFQYCTSLTSITLPNELKTINSGAFWGCTGLTSITLPEGVTKIGSNAFAECAKLASVTLPNSLETIDASAFYKCTSLDNIDLLETHVKTLGNQAFYGCTNLTEIKLPKELETIGVSAFSDCSSLSGITLPNSVKNIYSTAFYNCDSLQSIDLSNTSLNGIGSSAFWKCTSLESITLPDGVTSIGDSAFYCCENLTSITLPSTVTSIEYSAFVDCAKLTKIDLSATQVKTINNYTFSGCTSLESITLPKDVTSIGYAAFADCTGLKSIDLPDSVTSIGEQAFVDCTGLESITLPKGVTNIDEKAFKGCTSLRVNITSDESLPTIGENAFSGVGQVACTNPDLINDDLASKLGIDLSAVSKAYDLSKVTMAAIPSQIYVGERVEPTDVTLTTISAEDKEIKFVKGTDYTLDYGENELTGKGTVIITPTAKGKLCGSPRTETFDIYLVHFSNGGSESEGTKLPTAEMVSGSTLTLPSPDEFEFAAPEGQRFKNWEINTPNDTVYKDPEDKYNLETYTAFIVAVWEDIPTHTVTFDKNGGSGTMDSVQVTEGEKYVLPDKDCFTAPEGMEFKNWLVSTVNSSADKNPGDEITITSDTTVTAVWQDKTRYTVSFIANGGSGTMSPATVTEGGKYQLPACDFTAPTGKSFKAWQVDGQDYAVDAEITVNENMTVTATWQDKTRYTVSFNANGGSGTMEPVQVTKGEKYQLPACGFTAPEGHKFLNWQIGENNFAVNATYEISADTEIKAVWQPVDPENPTKPDNSYTITFEMGEGQLVGVPNPDYVTMGEPYKMPNATRSGYTLKHWAIGAAASSNTVNANEVYTFTADTTVYAIWKKNSGGGGSSSRPSSSGTTTPVNPEKPGTTNPGTPGTSNNTVTAANINNVFADVKNNAWYAEAIAYVYNKGIMNGTGNGQFEPNSPTTRAMLVTMLHRLEKEPGAGAINFGDVASGQWYSQAIAWAAANGIVKGYSDTQFAPNDEITREQLAVILFRYAQFKGLDVTAKGDLSSFGDSQNVSDWAKEAVEWAVGAGIINGDDQGNIAPTANATRAEVAMMLMRYLEK